MIPITWELIRNETSKDAAMTTLLIALRSGFPDELHHLDLIIPQWQLRHSLYELDGVILYKDRIVIPPSIRSNVLLTLHSAHQGVATMSNQARLIIFWPGITNDIIQTRARCKDCNNSAPSQAPLPTTPATPPSTPFEKIFADYFDCAGSHYLVIGDRLSG